MFRIGFAASLRREYGNVRAHGALPGAIGIMGVVPVVIFGGTGLIDLVRGCSHTRMAARVLEQRRPTTRARP